MTTKLSRTAYRSQLRISDIGVLALGFVVAAVFGLVAVTANVTAISLAIGAVGGVILMLAPRVAVWTLLIGGLGLGAAISLIGPLASRIPWVLALISFLLLALSIVQLGWRRVAPPFIWLILGFIFWAVVSSKLVGGSNADLIAGFKRYFQGLGLVFATLFLPSCRSDVRGWTKWVCLVAFLQFPFCIFQLLVLVPLRGGFGAMGSQVTDVVAGTFSSNLVGGSSNSDLVAYQLVSIAFLFGRFRVGQVTGFRFLQIAAILFSPLLMGETKIVVILVPLMGMILCGDLLAKSPGKFLALMIVLMLSTVAIVFFYVYVMLGVSISEAVADSMRYNIGAQGYGSLYLNRLTVLSFWYEHNINDVPSLILGHGLGSSYSTAGDLAGRVGMLYPNFGINLTAASTILWDLGAVGLLFYLLIICSAWRLCTRLASNTISEATRSDLRAIKAALALFVLYILYNDTQVNLLTTELIVAVLLSYLGYIWRIVNDHEAYPVAN